MGSAFELNGIEFEWDEEKYDLNLRKHNIRFEEAAEVFFDNFCLFGDAIVDGEPRDFVIGFSFSFNLLFTVYVERGDRMRIVSARPATYEEERFYAGKP